MQTEVILSMMKDMTTGNPTKLIFFIRDADVDWKLISAILYDD